MISSRRLSNQSLQRLELSLSDRDREVLLAVGNLGLMSGEQLWRTFFITVASADDGRRNALKVLSRLVRDDLLARLVRRVGGARRGSAGFVYVLGPAGQRLVRSWRGEAQTRARRPHEPGQQFVDHRLGVAEVFTSLKQAEHGGELKLTSFTGEPNCWRRRIGAFGETVTLKPDAYVCLQTGGRELHWFVEVDMATESRTVIARKGTAYLAHYQSGTEKDVMPRVAWLAPTPERAEVLARTLNPVSDVSTRLHAVALATNATQLLKGGTS